MGLQLSLNAALPLAGILATASDRCSKPSRERNSVRETTHGMRRQRMGLSSDAHRGWLSWLHRSNNNLIPDQARTNKQGQTEGHTAASNSSGKGIQLDLVQSQKEHYSMTKKPSFLSPSLPPTPHPPFPHPFPLPPSPPSPHPLPPTPPSPPPRLVHVFIFIRAIS